jgi:glutathione peroxidase
VLGFPSNDFGAQEPGTEKQIKDFCRLTYNVEFPMFEKTHAAEATADPLYSTLAGLAGEYPRWNFHKYLLDREGKLIGSFRSAVRPDDPQLIAAIEGALQGASVGMTGTP